MADQLKILVIEDGRDEAELAQAVLELEGYEVHVAPTVAVGMGMAETEKPPYAGIVSDNHLAGETSDGIALTAKRLTELSLAAGLVGWTSDKPLPAEDHIFPNGRDRLFAFAPKGGEIDLDSFADAVKSVLVPPKSN